MISLTRKSDYALVGVAGLAAAGDERLSARELSERLRLPLPALRNILKDLVQHGLVRSERGAHGGYQLARDPSRITVAEIVEAIEGAARLAPCCHGSARTRGGRGGDGAGAAGSPACLLEASCMIKASVRTLSERLNDVLRTTTIADLLASSTTRTRVRTRAGAPAGASALSIPSE